VLSRHQTAASASLERNDALARVADEMTAALGETKADAVMRGDARRIEFECAGAACPHILQGEAVDVRQGTAGTAIATARSGYGFRYLTLAGERLSWSTQSVEPLVGVALFAAVSDTLPAAFVRMREQQDFHCEYDVLIASCRTPAS
jgi:hypothetical protein